MIQSKQEEKRWTVLSNESNDSIDKLSEELGVSPFISQLLHQRGVDSFEKAKTFFRPSLDQLHDPFMMQDMQAAVDRVEEALANNQKILVYGDYDVDGTTAVSLMYSFLKTIHNEVEYYIPDRYTEGYGVSFQGVDYASENNFDISS